MIKRWVSTGPGQSIDSYIRKVTFRGAKTGNSPVDRSKLGTKRHILTDKNGIPLSAVIYHLLVPMILI